MVVYITEGYCAAVRRAMISSGFDEGLVEKEGFIVDDAILITFGVRNRKDTYRKVCRE